MPPDISFPEPAYFQQSPCFIIDAIINDIKCEEVLVDNGCQSYASVSDVFVRKHKPKLINIKERIMEGFLPNVRSVITKAAKFNIDLAGFKKTIWAYVVPLQVQNMMLGRAFLVSNSVLINEAAEALEFKGMGHIVPNKQRLARVTNLPTLISSGMFIEMARKGRQQSQVVESFSVTLADIDKALAPKTIVNPSEYMPNWLDQEFKKCFEPQEANKLPTHRPEVDHQIPLETDNNNKEKPVPWCAMYNYSRDELLVLRKTLTELLEKNFIRVSKSPAGAPILFVKKPGGCFVFA